MSSQCKGTTKSGSPCKITIVLPNGYCRVHQDQYVIEKEQDTKENTKESLKVESMAPEKRISEDKSENITVNNANSTSYFRKSNTDKRWYLVPVLVITFLWFIVLLLKQKK